MLSVYMLNLRIYCLEYKTKMGLGLFTILIPHNTTFIKCIFEIAVATVSSPFLKPNKSRVFDQTNVSDIEIYSRYSCLSLNLINIPKLELSN